MPALSQKRLVRRGKTGATTGNVPTRGEYMLANKNKANIVLAGTTAGYLLTLPFQDSFTGGLLSSGLGAAMVGGAADWFAVTALFRRPLGISFKTAVIPRSRQRIITEMLDMLENRLLTKENIQNKLCDYDMTALLLSFTRQGGKADLLCALPAFLRDFILRIKPQELGEYLTHFGKENAHKISLSCLLANALTWSNAHGYTAKILDFMLQKADIFAGSKKAYTILYEFIEAVRKTYAGDYAERKLADWLFDIGGFTPEYLAQIAQNRLHVFLQDLQQPGHEIREEFLNYAEKLPGKLAEDGEWQEKIETWKLELVNNKVFVTAVARYVRQHGGNAAEASFIEFLDKQVEIACQHITSDEKLYKKVDDYLTNILGILVERYYSKVRKLLSDSLEKYTAEELANLIESKVSNDLQMIRLNGSIVGAFVGMVIFLFTQVITR